MAAIDEHTTSGIDRSSLAPTSRDRWLAAVLIVAVIAEAVLRRDMVYPVVAAVGGTVIVLASLWRRRYPLQLLVLTFTIIITGDIVAYTRVGRPIVLYTGLVVVVILIHALFRWGSRNEVLAGIGVLAVAVIESQIVEFRGFGNVLLSVFVLIATAELGWLARSYYLGQEARRRMDLLLERERLARELHDTVAHRVSAITISAQAGKVRARGASSEVLASFDEIEREATRAMAEMRLIVGRYREDPVDLSRGGDPRDERANNGDESPAALESDDAAATRMGGEPTGPRLHEIAQLASDATHPTMEVDVTVTDDLDDLDAEVESTAYRIAQESITNAFRHARNATRVEVAVVGEPDALRLTIRDDGDVATTNTTAATTTAGARGFGLRGMNERAALLGGTLRAGPGPVRGWLVEAELPRTELPRNETPRTGPPQARPERARRSQAEAQR